MHVTLRVLCACALVWVACEPEVLSARGRIGAPPVPEGAPSTSFDVPVWNPVTVFGPAPRAYHSLVYDQGRQRVVLHGGYALVGGAGLTDTWEWDGNLWTELSPTTTPPGQGAAPFVYVPNQKYDLLFAQDGSTWAWNGTEWSELATTGPPASYSGTMAFDSGRNRTVLFGGVNGPDFRDTVPNETWEWDGTSWTRMATSGPSQRCGAVMVYDAKMGVTLLFGGFDANAVVLGDMWTWDGTEWTQLVPAGGLPPPRRNAGWAYDDVRDVAVLFGGQDDPVALSDTWEWDGAAWARVSTSVTPGGRFLAPLIYDDVARRAIVLFGSNLSGYIYYDDMWEYYTISLGGSCSSGAQCDSAAYCVQGICCESACSGPCETCSALPGRCALLTQGAPGSPSCAPYVCTGSSPLCANSCVGDTDCSADSYCRAADGVCTSQVATGGQCSASTQCVSGECVDGVCCDASCAGQCEACDVAGSVGTCSAVVGAPHGARAGCTQASGAAACTRICDGKTRDACAGTQCGIDQPCAADADCAAPLKCNPTSRVCTPPPSVCDGDHTISLPGGGTTDCTPYRCTPDAVCVTACSSTADCVDGNRCQSTGVCEAPGAFAANAPGCAVDRLGIEGDAACWPAITALAALGASSRRRRRRRRE
jgi:hypothetical protein